ncbi:MAG: hypothetical protein Q9178_008095 [Gyalolechia marmorata]
MWSHESTFPSKLEKALGAAPISSRSLPSIQPDTSAAPRGVPQQASSAPNVSAWPALWLSFGDERSINPIACDTTSAGGRQHDGDSTDSLWTPPIAATSCPVLLPSSTRRKHPAEDNTLPSVAPWSRDTRLLPLPTKLSSPPYLINGVQQLPAIRSRKGSDPLLPLGTMTDTSVLPPRPFGLPNQLGRTGNPALQNSSPASALPQLASYGKFQSYVSTPSTSTGPTSTEPQLAYNQEAFCVPTSKNSGQSPNPITVLETVQGRIQLPVDIQTASKAANKKRKRNATASSRFRQRRKEQEQKTLDEVANLEIQVRQLSKVTQQQQDILQKVDRTLKCPLETEAATLGAIQHLLFGS